MNFIEKCRASIILDPFEEINDAIDEWHKSDSVEELHEYLGMTLDEYQIFMVDHSSIDSIISKSITCGFAEFSKNSYIDPSKNCSST